jgi:hypothetical protein
MEQMSGGKELKTQPERVKRRTLDLGGYGVGHAGKGGLERNDFCAADTIGTIP